MSMHHASKTLRNVVHRLAKQGSAKEKLIDALIKGEFVTIRAEDMHGFATGGVYKSIFEALTKVPAHGLEASFIASINEMSDEEVERLTAQVVDLAFGAVQAAMKHP